MRDLPPILLAFLALGGIVLPVLVALIGDGIQFGISRQQSLHSWVIVEELTHGIQAAAVCLPLFWNRRRFPFIVLPLLLGSVVIDSDHWATAAEQARNLPSYERPQDAFEMANDGIRTPAHSLACVALVTVGLLVLTSRVDWAGIAGLALTAHLVRDSWEAPLAILWPSPTFYSSSHSTYIMLEMALGAVAFCLLLVYERINLALKGSLLNVFSFLLPRTPPPDWLAPGGGPPPAIPRGRPSARSRQAIGPGARARSSSRSSSTRSSDRSRHSGGGSHRHSHASSRPSGSDESAGSRPRSHSGSRSRHRHHRSDHAAPRDEDTDSP